MNTLNTCKIKLILYLFYIPCAGRLKTGVGMNKLNKNTKAKITQKIRTKQEHNEAEEFFGE